MQKGNWFDSWRRTHHQETAYSKLIISYRWSKAALQPAGLLEDAMEHDRGQNHQRQGERVAEHPGKLWHDLEVHPVYSRYQRGREQDGGPGGDLFDLVVLV